MPSRRLRRHQIVCISTLSSDFFVLFLASRSPEVMALPPLAPTNEESAHRVPLLDGAFRLPLGRTFCTSLAQLKSNRKLLTRPLSPHFHFARL